MIMLNEREPECATFKLRLLNISYHIFSAKYANSANKLTQKISKNFIFAIETLLSRKKMYGNHFFKQLDFTVNRIFFFFFFFSFVTKSAFFIGIR